MIQCENIYKWITFRSRFVAAECLPYEETGELFRFRVPGIVESVSAGLTFGVIRAPGRKCALVDSPDVHERSQLGTILNGNNLRGLGVEIGTHRAVFASEFMDKWDGACLYCVDPWSNSLQGYDDQYRLLEGGGADMQRDMQLAASKLSRFGDRVEMMQMSSLAASSIIQDSSLDFVYIDGDHRRSFVIQDMEVWWPKIRPGGIMAGHDWDGEWEHDVRSAVESFCEAMEIPACMLVPGDAMSWYFHKAKGR